MEYARYLDALDVQNDALRAAAVAAGPDTPVPTCPEWTVLRLVRHIARVQSWVLGAIRNPDGGDIKAGQAPDSWVSLLSWWDEQRAALRGALDAGPDAPAWLPFPSYPRTTHSWARRQAHEAAIHRLDAEHALAGSGAPDALPTLLFDSDFAADGVDELLVMLLPNRGDWSSSTTTGTVMVHAADAGRAWAIQLEAGRPPRVDALENADPVPVDAESTIAGTADATYRAVWGRPSTAVVSDAGSLLGALAAP